MTLLLDIFRALNANQHPSQIALSIVIALWFGFTPLFSPHTVFLVFLIFVLRINLGAVIVLGGFFGGISYLLDPAFHQLGLWALNHPSMQDIWAEMYNHTLWLFLGFNNTLFMGSLIVTSLLSIPLFIISWQILKLYQTKILASLNKLKIVQLVKANHKVQLFMRYMS